MTKDKIKADWAVIQVTIEQNIIVYTQIKDKIQFLFFDSKEAFLESIRKKHLSVCRWAVSIPDSQCIKKTLDLPAQTFGEAFRMVEFELASLVPIQPDNLVYGCTLLNQQENIIEVLVYILRNDTLVDLLKPYHDLGIYPEKVLPDSVSLFSCFENKLSNNTIDIYLDEHRCHILESLKGYICSAVQFNTVDLRNNEDKANILDILIHKEFELEAFQENTNIEIISIDTHKDDINNLLTSSKSKVPFAFCSLPHFISQNVHLGFFNILVASGCFRSIHTARYEHLNLLPSYYISALNRKRKRKNLITNVGLSVLALVLIWGFFFLSNWRITRTCHKVQSMIAPIEQIASNVDQKKHLVRALQNQFLNRQEIGVIFRELYQFSPKSITISDIQYKQKAGKSMISMKGQSDTLSNAFDYSEAMKNSNLLQDIQITNVQQIPTAGGSVVEFRAECVIQRQ